MTQQDVKNYLLKLKSALKRTALLKEKFLIEYMYLEQQLDGTKDKSNFLSKLANKVLKKTHPKLERDVIVSPKKINEHLDTYEQIYINCLTYTNKHNCKNTCDMCVKVLDKLGLMIEELYEHTCSIYNIKENNLNNNQIIK